MNEKMPKEGSDHENKGEATILDVEKDTVDGEGKEDLNEEENQRNLEELNDLKKEWFENGGFLSEDKQNRLNELEDIVNEYKVMEEKLSADEEGHDEEEKEEGFIFDEEEVDEWKSETERLKREYAEKKAKGELSETEEEAYRKNIEMLERTMVADDEVASETGPEVVTEELLGEKRKQFARVYRDAEKMVDIKRGRGMDYARSDHDGYSQKEEEYFEALMKYRKQKVESIDVILSPEDRRKEMEIILNETVAMEANRLEDAKLSLEIEERSGSLAEKTKNIGKRMVNAYRKLPLKYKIAVSAGLFGAAGATAGGTAIAMIAGGGIAAQRILGGAAVGVTLEASFRKLHDKMAEREVRKEFGKGLEEYFANNSEELNRKIIALESKKGGQRRKRYIASGLVGAVIGAGAVARLTELFGGINEAQASSVEVGSADTAEVTDIDLENWRTPTEESTLYDKGEYGLNYPEFDPPSWGEDVADPVASTAEGYPAELVYEVEPGSSVWGTTENFLKEKLGSNFDGLNEAQRTHLIDQIKNKIAEDPSKFGMEGVENIDFVQAGQKIDFSPLMEDNVMGKMLESSSDLSREAMESIISNNEAIAEWVRENPGERLTTEKVREILSGEASGSEVPEFMQGEAGQPVEVAGEISELESVMERYNIPEGNEEAVRAILDTLERTALDGPSRQALEDIYFLNWNSDIPTFRTEEVLKGFFGEEYEGLKEFFKDAREISRDENGNVLITMSRTGFMSWNNWNVIVSPGGTVAIDGPPGWGLHERPLNEDSLSEVRGYLMRYVVRIKGES